MTCNNVEQVSMIHVHNLIEYRILSFNAQLFRNQFRFAICIRTYTIIYDKIL